MVADFAWLFPLIVACSANIALQIVSMRLFPSRGIFQAMLAGFTMGLVLLLAGQSAFGRRLTLGSQLANLAIYFCFAYSYFHFNNMMETARRVRIAIEFYEARDGLTRNELFSRYGAGEIIDRRLARLMGSGQIHQVGSRYVLGNPSVLAMARIVRVLKRVVRGRAA